MTALRTAHRWCSQVMDSPVFDSAAAVRACQFFAASLEYPHTWGYPGSELTAPPHHALRPLLLDSPLHIVTRMVQSEPAPSLSQLPRSEWFNILSFAPI